MSQSVFSSYNLYFIDNFIWNENYLCYEVSTYKQNNIQKYVYDPRQENFINLSGIPENEKFHKVSLSISYPDRLKYFSRYIFIHNNPIGFYTFTAKRSYLGDRDAYYTLNIKFGKINYKTDITFFSKEDKKEILLYTDNDFINTAIILPGFDIYGYLYYDIKIFNSITGEIIRELSLNNLRNFYIDKTRFSYIKNSTLITNNFTTSDELKEFNDVSCYDFSSDSKYLCYFSIYKQFNIFDYESDKYLIKDVSIEEIENINLTTQTKEIRGIIKSLKKINTIYN